MNLALGHAFSLKHIFDNFNYKKLKADGKKCKEVTGDVNRDSLVYKIFMASVEMVFNDIIDNNVTFLLPTGSRKADIHIKRYAYEDFAKGRQAGKWADIDYLSSRFSGYQMVLAMYNREGKPVREKPIYLDKYLNKKLSNNINAGKQYF